MSELFRLVMREKQYFRRRLTGLNHFGIKVGVNKLELKVIYMCLSSIYNTLASTELDCCKISISFIPFVEIQRCGLFLKFLSILLQK